MIVQYIVRLLVPATYSVFLRVVTAELCVTRLSLIVKTVSRDTCYLRHTVGSNDDAPPDRSSLA
jgi:hypothetical protein